MTAMGEYTEGKLDDLIKQITADIQIQKTLKKKLKGKYEKDTVTLMTTAGLDEKQASDWAYIAAEVIIGSGWYRYVKRQNGTAKRQKQ